MTNAQPSIDEADWIHTDAPAEARVSPSSRERLADGFDGCPSPSNLETTDGSIRKRVRHYIVSVAAWRPSNGSPADAAITDSGLNRSMSSACVYPLEDLKRRNDE